MNLTLSLLQQILSLPQEETLVPLDRFFASRDERELQLLGFLPPDEEEKIPALPPSPLIAWTIRRIGRRKKPALAAAVRRPTARC